jgi:hypothetical protein
VQQLPGAAGRVVWLHGRFHAPVVGSSVAASKSATA